MGIAKTQEYFLIALRDVARKRGRGFQKRLIIDTGKSSGFISQILDPTYSKKIALETQELIAEACGIDYLELVQTGKNLSIGKHINSDDQSLIPMDPAIQLLHEALEETGVKINEKQKQAVLKILREELKKSEGKSKDDIKKYLEAFGK